MLKEYLKKQFKLKKLFLFTLFIIIPTIVYAVTVTHQQIVDAVRNSPANSWLKEHADAIANLAINVESGGRLDAYNGLCCHGLLQLTKSNIHAFGKMSPEQYRNSSLQTQINIWAKLTNEGFKSPVIKKLIAMDTFDGQPVTGEFVLACIQLGIGNCNKMLRSGKCSGFRDAFGTSICDMARKMANGKGTTKKPNIDPDTPPEPPTIFTTDFLDKILDSFETGAAKWEEELTKAASVLFWILVTISLVWTGIDLIFNKGDTADFFSEIIKFLLFTGFFWWLIVDGTPLTKDIIESFIVAGLRTGTDYTSSTSQYMDIIFQLWTRSFEGIGDLDIPEKLAAIIMLVGTFCSLTIVVINYILLQISAWLYLYAGIFTLGFGGSRWTSNIAINYYKQVINLGFQLMTYILLLNIAKSIMQQIIPTSNNFQLYTFMVLFIVSILLSMLCIKLPAMVGGTITSIGNVGTGLSLKSASGHLLASSMLVSKSANAMKKSVLKYAKKFKTSK